MLVFSIEPVPIVLKSAVFFFIVWRWENASRCRFGPYVGFLVVVVYGALRQLTRRGRGLALNDDLRRSMASIVLVRMHVSIECQLFVPVHAMKLSSFLCSQIVEVVSREQYIIMCS